MKVAVWTTINCAHHLLGTKLHGHTDKVMLIYEGEPDIDGKIKDVGKLRVSAHARARPH